MCSTRPQGVAMSHREALARCVHLAQEYARQSDDSLPELHVSFAQLASRVARIVASDYCSQVRESSLAVRADERAVRGCRWGPLQPPSSA